MLGGEAAKAEGVATHPIKMVASAENITLSMCIHSNVTFRVQLFHPRV